MGHDQGFSDLWRDAQQTRTAYLGLLLSLFRSSSKTRKVPEPERSVERIATNEVMQRAA
jgi:hypothetical protein